MYGNDKITLLKQHILLFVVNSNGYKRYILLLLTLRPNNQ